MDGGACLRRDLSKDQYGQGQDSGGDTGCKSSKSRACQPSCDHKGREGGGGDVDNVVADQNGGQQLVILLRQLQGFDRTAAAVVRPVLQADAVE